MKNGWDFYREIRTRRSFQSKRNRWRWGYERKEARSQKLAWYSQDILESGLKKYKQRRRRRRKGGGERRRGGGGRRRIRRSS